MCKVMEDMRNEAEYYKAIEIAKRMKIGRAHV